MVTVNECHSLLTFDGDTKEATRRKKIATHLALSSTSHLERLKLKTQDTFFLEEELQNRYWSVRSESELLGRGIPGGLL